ncbi:hypothetical protein ACFL02_07775, partial [Planctomycetota bacterium]
YQDIFIGKKPIPIRLLSGVADSLRVDKYMFKPGVKKPDTDHLKIEGALTVRDGSIDIANENVLVSWGNYSITLPADNLYRIRQKEAFKFKKPKGADSSIAVAIFNLEKCTFKIIINRADIGAQGYPVDFGLKFGNFNASTKANFNKPFTGIGTIQYNSFEGGFYGIVADNGERYDPVNLPAKFARDNLRVLYRVKELPERVSVHMWGTIVEILGIEIF